MTDRREFLGSTLSAMLAGGVAPAFVRAESTKPKLAQGAAIGDLTADQAILWTRTDRPCRLFVEYDTTPRFANSTVLRLPAAIENTDFTSKLELAGLPFGQTIHYRIVAEDLRDSRNRSEPLAGSFRTQPRFVDKPRDIIVAYTGDVAGQGWGIDPDRGGMKIFESMRKADPDLFIHLGDSVYADGPIEKEVKLNDGTLWKNLVTPEKSKVAETLDEFRGAYRYNLLDEHYRALNASVAQMVLWDDHETRNNWFPGNVHTDKRYLEKSDSILAARARAAFLEYQPIRIDPRQPERLHRVSRMGPLLDVFAWDMRSYRGPNIDNRSTKSTPESAILGADQLNWIKRELAASNATWKIIASDMPLACVVEDGPNRYEAVANGDDGPPLGRELEIAELLQFISESKIRNVVFITADVHYAAAHYFNPNKAKFQKFDPFWEFVAGPAHAGTFGPNKLDATFGPELKFLSIPEGMKPNRPPSEGFQFFGTLKIDAGTRVLSSRLHDIAGKELFRVDLPPAA